jgi:two-component system phosphate regulon response regulator PhoB
MQILLVDDDEGILHFFGMAFTSAGHQVTTASTGGEALALAESHQFDAVLLDVEMPAMSGWRVLEGIQRLPTGSQVPVILFTAYGNVTSDAYAEMLGAYALVRKPVAPAEILELINRAIEERKASSAKSSQS